MNFKTLLSLIVLISAGFAVHAQVTTSSINGIITDRNNEPLIGANITATHEPTGIFYGTSTRADGRFNLPNLRIGGPYKIIVSYTGFEDYTIEGINLKLGEKRPLDVIMQDASVELNAVEVTAGGIISEGRTGAETNVTSDQINALPTISRSASDFTRLTPASDGNSFAGRNDQFNNFSLDGSIFNNPFGLDAATPGGQSGAQPISLDAIDQITVSLAPYDVTQAGFTGAAVNAVTKSGTNDISGTVFGFFRNDDMTGGSVSGEEIVVPDLSQYQVGFTLGGPIVKNKLFFFINAEIDNREDLGATAVASRSGVTGSNVSRVAANDLDIVSQVLQERFGYETGAYEGYLHETNSTKGLAKLDWNINQNHTLTATYNFLDAFQQKPAHPSALGRRGPDLTTLQFFNSGYQINNRIHSGILELRSLFGNKASNKLQVGYTAFRDTRDPFSDPFPVININRDGIRYIIAGHEPFSINNRLTQDVFQFTDNFNIYAGSHTITIGTSLERFDFDNSFNLDAYGGTFGPGYGSVSEFVDAVQAGDLDETVNNARGTFEANGGDDGKLGEGWALAETNVGQFALYAQDEWEVNRKLNLTYGIRMDLPLYFNTPDKIQENLDRQCCYDPSITWFDEDGNPQNFDHTELPEQRPLISPRLGFNYDIKGDKSSQLRGGTGIFSGRLPFVWIGNQVANPNFFFYNYTARNYRFPQVWRSNLGYDQTFANGFTATVDLIYTKDVNASMVRNYGLRTPTGTLPGVDDRPIYTNDDRVLVFGAPTNAYIFTNTDVGYTFNASFQLQKAFANGTYLMLGYNFLDAEDASSIEAEISGDAYDRNPAIGNINDPISAPSLYGNRHRIIGSAVKKWNYGNWATTVSTFFSFQNAGTTQNDNTADFRFSYTYSGDINNDGSGLNDLIYIPTDAELDQQQWVNDGQREAFRDFIEQDDYLSENRGDYMEKYAIVAPWNSNWDVRLLQDYNLENGQMIQFSLDIVNFGNLLNSNWNVKQLPVNTQPVGVSIDDKGEPVYSFDSNLTSTFADDFSLLSRWQARVGLRYSF